MKTFTEIPGIPLREISRWVGDLVHEKRRGKPEASSPVSSPPSSSTEALGSASSSPQTPETISSDESSKVSDETPNTTESTQAIEVSPSPTQENSLSEEPISTEPSLESSSEEEVSLKEPSSVESLEEDSSEIGKEEDSSMETPSSEINLTESSPLEENPSILSTEVSSEEEKHASPSEETLKSPEGSLKETSKENLSEEIQLKGDHILSPEERLAVLEQKKKENREKRKKEWQALFESIREPLVAKIKAKYSWNDERIGIALSALDIIDRRQLDRLRRVSVLKPENPEEKLPKNGLKLGEIVFVVEYLPMPERPRRGRGFKDHRKGRGGKRGFRPGGNKFGSDEQGRTQERGRRFESRDRNFGAPSGLGRPNSRPGYSTSQGPGSREGKDSRSGGKPPFPNKFNRGPRRPEVVRKNSFSPQTPRPPQNQPK